MERGLLEAARKGNIDELNDLIRRTGLILEEMALQGAGHTPLHIACVAGHSNFVRELLKLMPKLAKIANADGYSPLHIAAARGDVETVKEILKAGWPRYLCHVKGRERRIPLHCAAANGEVGTMKELLSASPESIEETTAREETALHLSVKNNRFDALVMLVEHLRQHNKEQVINWKDRKGNTILHLAAAAQNFEVVDFMLSGHALKREVIEVNALNESGSTPLDVSSPSDPEIREILMQAGARHGQSNLPRSEIVLADGDQDNNKRAISYTSVPKPAVGNDHPTSSPTKDPDQGQKSPATLGQKHLDDKSNDLLVVAVLIVSATFQAVIQPPTLFKKVDTHTEKGFLAAFFSFWASTFVRNFALFCFLSSNTFGFLLSVQMIIDLTKNLPMRRQLGCSTVSMVLTYVNCMANVPSRSLLDENYRPLGAVLIGTLAFLIPAALVSIQKKKTTR